MATADDDADGSCCRSRLFSSSRLAILFSMSSVAPAETEGFVFGILVADVLDIDVGLDVFVAAGIGILEGPS